VQSFLNEVLAIHSRKETILIAPDENARPIPAVFTDIAASSKTTSALARPFGITEQAAYKRNKRSIFGGRLHTAHNLQTAPAPTQEIAVIYRDAPCRGLLMTCWRSRAKSFAAMSHAQAWTGACGAMKQGNLNP
jgi:hypothetical protein